MKSRTFKIAAIMAGVLLVNSATVEASESLLGWLFTLNRENGVKPVTNKSYNEECGSCHFPYQPGWLPAQSWEKLLTATALHNHFGEVADLDPETLRGIHDYAVENSADKSYYKRSRKITAATNGVEAPLRITEVRYIKRKHHDIPEEMIKGNKNVKSLSNCNACHTRAADGVFDADTVSIPNFPNY